MIPAGQHRIRNMQAGVFHHQNRTANPRAAKVLGPPCPFRQQNLTFWPKSHPVVFPHVHTDHWTKMKTRVPSHLVSLPAARVMEKGVSWKVSPLPEGQGAGEQYLPPLEPNPGEISLQPSCGQNALGVSHSVLRNRISLQDRPQYRNEYNDRARRGFRYWLIENRIPKSYGYSFGAYKTLLGLPGV
ncbi:hypothetical protein AAFF_G00263840 [Aldrovandia affinis]|uniref:Uncharacterized protein n=1 Tax=Aldrovandia affinis TaxID=143900 RepID=A0AAD7SUP7_9TELE|nr:hypothetical protein AAFF_G00263840 [Aldrovandia affinis]